jgi:hypothetical protein
MTESRTELQIDLDAFAPAPGKSLRFKGQTYMVRNFSDIGIDDALRILRAEDDLRGKSAVEQLHLLLQYMTILIPDMDRATLGAMSQNKALAVWQEALGVAEVPPMAGAAPSDSGTASPLSADSTGGQTTPSAS